MAWALLFCTTLSVAGESTLAEYRRRASALSVDSVAGHFRLALWCQGKKLDVRARKHIRAVLATEPRHRAALRALRREERAHAKEALKLTYRRGRAERARGLAVLELLGEKERSRALVIAARNRHSDVRVAAVRALAGSSEAAVAKALARRALYDSADLIRKTALESLRATRRKDLASLFLGALRSPSDTVRIRALEALAAFGDSNTARLLVRRYSLVGGNPQQAYLSTTTQISFIQDFDVEVA